MNPARVDEVYQYALRVEERIRRRQSTRGKYCTRGRGGQSGERGKAINRQEGDNNSTQQRQSNNDNERGKITSRCGKGGSGGRGATYRCYKCNKLGYRSFECPDNEETKHRKAHIAQGEEEDLSLQAMDEIPEIGEAMVMRKVLLK